MKRWLSRLNGWQRFGIVLTILWTLLVTFAMSSGAVKDKEEFYRNVYDGCVDEKLVPDCNAYALEAKNKINTLMVYGVIPMSRTSFGVFYGFVSSIMGWLSVYSLIYIMRWVKNRACQSS